MVDIKKYGIEPFGATPNERQVAHYKIGKKVFFHFGVNTFTSSEWGNGTEVEDIFDPTALDTDQWLRVAKEAGFELAILTVKHHDGFCLWPSAYTEHSVKNSPYKNGKGDVVREFVDSCHKYGLKVGLYISPWDRHSPHWGKDDYNDYFANQLTEILTGYGEVHEVWWDGAGSRDAVYDWDRWESIVRKTQPKAAIFGSMGAAGHIDLRWGGNESGYVSEPHYASIELGTIVDEVRSVLNTGQMGASAYVPSEVDVSIRPGWFYHPDQDTKVKTASRINKIWFDSVGRNSMMLLSFPPDTRGLVCDRDAENAIASGKCIEKMLSHNYADGADISHGGSQMTVVDDADGEESTVYLTDAIDIVLPKSERVNVFSIGELIEAGERINSFTLEAIGEDGEATLLYQGKSVGFRRAFLFDEGEYKHLRFSVKGCLASPMLKNIGIYLFEDIEDEEGDLGDGELVRTIERSEDGHSAEAAFGGIFPFDRIEFSLDAMSKYKVYTFSGQVYELLCEGEGKGRIGINLPEPIRDCYRIKVEANVGISAVGARLR